MKFARRMVAVLLLGVLTSQRALAQELPVQTTTETPAPEGPEPAPVQASPPADPGSAAEVGSAARAPASTNPQVAPEAVATAWQELHSIRKREAALFKQQVEANPGLPAVGITLGLPMFGVMLPYGAVLIAQANSPAESGPIDDHTRRVGTTLICFGALGFAMLAASTYVLLRMRRSRMQRDAEIQSLEQRRALLARIVEADWRALGASAR